MSKIEQLIKEKCPDGVNKVSLGSLMKRIKEKNYKDSGLNIVYSVTKDKGIVKSDDLHDFNVYSTNLSNYNILRYNQYAYNPARLNIGSIARLKNNEPGLVSPMYVIFELDNTKIINKYFELLLFSKQVFNEMLSFVEQGARFRFDYNNWNKIFILLPPIEVQEEIVKILDKFSELETELEAELETRKNQYKFWLEKLFNKNNKFEKLKDIADIYLGLTHTPTYVDNGIKFISSANISKNFLDLKNVKYISEKEYKEMTPNAKPQKGDILFVRVGSNLGHPVIFNSNEKIGIFVSIGFLRVKDTKLIDNKYLKYWMNSNNFMSQVKSKTQNAPKANLNSTWMREFKISIPPLQEQERIVKILDKFDKLINDISEGIPAEIEARRKQYEYYRNKLLSFEELKTNE